MLLSIWASGVAFLGVEQVATPQTVDQFNNFDAMTTIAPWTEYEKRFLLAEIIKTSPVSLDSLLRIVREQNIQPNWEEIFLPTARNVNACRGAFNDLLSNSPASFQQHQGTFEATPPISKKRRYSDAEPLPSNVRALKPKPAENGEQGNAFRSSSGNALPKKRGRPSKEEIAQRQAEAAARGETYPPPKPPVRKSTGSAAPVMNTTFSAGPIGPQPPEAVAETPGSGKKKRGRPSTASKDDMIAPMATKSPPAAAASYLAEAHQPTLNTPQRNPEQVKEEIPHDTPPPPPAPSSVEIPDSAASSHTIFQASGPL